MLDVPPEHTGLHPLKAPCIFHRDDGIRSGDHAAQDEAAIKVALVPTEQFPMRFGVFRHQGSQTNLLRRSLHPILAELKLEKAGLHAMRRFRTTWLRKQRAPEDLIKFWLGHAKESVTDGYSKLADDVEFRAEVAETDVV